MPCRACLVNVSSSQRRYRSSNVNHVSWRLCVWHGKCDNNALVFSTYDTAWTNCFSLVSNVYTNIERKDSSNICIKLISHSTLVYSRTFGNWNVPFVYSKRQRFYVYLTQKNLAYDDPHETLDVLKTFGYERTTHFFWPQHLLNFIFTLDTTLFDTCPRSIITDNTAQPPRH